MDFANSQESGVPAAFSNLLFAIDRTPEGYKSAVIHRALDVLDRLRNEIASPAQLDEHVDEGPSRAVNSLTLPGSLAQLDIAPRTPSEQIAVDSCIASACALLRVTHMLLNRTTQASPRAELEHWDKICELTREAGRGAYRAALMLVDPQQRQVPLG